MEQCKTVLSGILTPDPFCGTRYPNFPFCVIC
jgi:hypothetical protein